MVFLYITCKNFEESDKIADAIMEARAAGCINIFPSRSVWRDDETGNVQKYEEIVLVVKTLESKMQDVEEIVRKEGSYHTPCIAAFPASRINREYKEWLGKVVG